MIKINYIPTFVGDYNLVGEKMSEICLECYNEIMGTNDPPEKMYYQMIWTFVKNAVN